VRIVPKGSGEVRPVQRRPGNTPLLDALYPIAISPAESMAVLPIQRKVASGAKVPCWYSVTPERGLRNSYQRTPTLDPAVTEWFTTRAS